jgi:hypothetical protein
MGGNGGKLDEWKKCAKNVAIGDGEGWKIGRIYGGLKEAGKGGKLFEGGKRGKLKGLGREEGKMF